MSFRRLALAALAALAASALAGCQTPEQSLMSAQDMCAASGYRPGTKTFNRCVQTAYRDNRMEAQAANNAVLAGATAGLVGGAVVAATTYPGGYYYGPGPYYGGPYYRPRYYGYGYGGGPYYGTGVWYGW